MNRLPNKEENPNGLHARYFVEKVEGETDPNAEYFVLRLDDGGSDSIHIEACRKAVLHYAELIKDHIPQLSKDIFERYSK